LLQRAQRSTLQRLLLVADVEYAGREIIHEAVGVKRLVACGYNGSDRQQQQQPQRHGACINHLLQRARALMVAASGIDAPHLKLKRKRAMT
jgi:hypothetical protein